MWMGSKASYRGKVKQRARVCPGLYPQRVSGVTSVNMTRESAAVARADCGVCKRNALHPVNWLAALRGYLLVTGVLNLCWETVQLPLYTVWSQGTPDDMLFVVIHCTAGDLLIATSFLIGALVVAGEPGWPRRGGWVVAILTTLGGLGYTLFSEWLNVQVRATWAYSALMPTLPPFGTGLSPMLQWLVIPTVALWVAHRGSAAGNPASKT